jgi:hypothetical protein
MRYLYRPQGFDLRDGQMRRVAGLVLATLIAFAAAAADDDGRRFTSFLGLRLNLGTLDDVQARLGRTRLIESYDSGDYEARLCYLGADGIVSFLSGQAGGAQLGLLGFELKQSSTAAAQGCRQLSRRYAEASKDLGGLHLGMTRAEFAALVGGPVEWDGDTGRRLYESDQRMTSQEQSRYRDSPELTLRGTFAVTVTVTARFEQDRLVEVAVWKIVSA